MGINQTSPTTFTTAVLIGDTKSVTGGSNDVPPVMTTVGNPPLPIDAALEIQSTTGGFVLPRMTTTQKNALTPVVNGMQVFDSTLGSVQFFTGGIWSQASAPSGIQYATGTFTSAQLNGMYAVPISILAAPGANVTYLVEKFAYEIVGTGTGYAGGGITILEYGNVAHGAGPQAASTIPAGEYTATSSLFFTMTAISIQTTMANAANLAIYLSNDTAAFTGGGAGTINWYIWFRVIPTVA